MKVAIALINGGDGSVSVKFFDSEENAETFMEKDNERYCEDVKVIDLPLDESRVQFAQVEGEQCPKYSWRKLALGEMIKL